MVGSGLGNFGFGNVGIFGQQEWQQRARDEAFGNLYSRGLQMAGGSPMASNPMQRFGAQAYAASFFPLGSTLSGGTTTTSNLSVAPFAGQRVPKELGGMQSNWWNQNQAFRFPFS